MSCGEGEHSVKRKRRNKMRGLGPQSVGYSRVDSFPSEKVEYPSRGDVEAVA